MTGQELIDAIVKYNLEDCELVTQKPHSQNGDYLEFSIPDPKEYEKGYNKILWYTEDWYQDVIFNREGDVTYHPIN